MPEKRIHVWVQLFQDRKNLVLQWIDPVTNRRRSKSARTADPKKAEAVRTDQESDLNNGRYLKGARMTWEDFRNLFEEQQLAGCRLNTRNNYATMLDQFEEACNPRSIGSISERTVSGFVSYMRKKSRFPDRGMAASSIKARLLCLHAVLNWAANQKIVSRCPDFPKIKVSRKKPQPVATESFERLLGKAGDQQMRVLLQCGWLPGLRMAEALTLERKETDKAPWVNFDRDRIIFPAGVVKADEDQWVPLDPVLRTELENLPQQGRKVFFFTSEDGRPITQQGVGGRVVRLARAAGVKMTMRTLRRGFGCRYAGKVPAQVLQKLMRHSNITITMEYYANVDDAVEEAVLGEKRNRFRNSAQMTAHISTKVDATCQSASNS